MPRSISKILAIKPGKRGGIQASIIKQLRDLIVSGALQPGVRIPSTRSFAVQNKVSRQTSRIVYDQLIAEGYLVSKPGSGTIVASFSPPQVQSRERRATHEYERSSFDLSKRAQMLQATAVTVPRKFVELRPFRSWLPSLNDFPVETWGRLSRRSWCEASDRSLRYGGPQGLKALREQICYYVREERGIDSNPESVIIVSGSQEALFLCGLICGEPNDLVAIEDPGYIGARGAFIAAGLKLDPIELDDEGISPRALDKSRARLVFVTPSHQYPCGIVMSLQRRQALLQWAHQRSGLIIEDDYDSDFFYGSSRIPALKAIDQSSSVAYVGSFSKSLVPSLRLGYLILPDGLIEPCLRTRALIDRGSPSIDQVTLARFMEEGHFRRHVRAMRKLYRERRDFLVQSLQNETGDELTVRPTNVGMHLIGIPSNRSVYSWLKASSERVGLDLTYLSDFALKPLRDDGIMFGFSALPKQKMRDGVRNLALVLKSRK